ncbi:hypothetical protein C8F04DRAFT_979867 [Mycena alexandri]|uniref:CxC2-like cysteine cluster KDZ transposase-associated domain-containing protein n=1 Tax=Mycena alexandri TaxID=1745969 RepID=A0AAD6RXN1_9AGAR|nr:hypothetical protein C8F04DRAFT_979867 [Mycena alexandri]
MRTFVDHHREETLDEWLRTEGRGSAKFYEACARCKEAAPQFRCSRQTCLGPALYCGSCIVAVHAQLPTHMIEKWTGEFFKAMTLNELGARIQLGHVPGSFCPKATKAHKDFVIIDTLGIRTVQLNFCGCDSTVTHRQQLMRACLWPATSIDPQTCATFNAVRLFEVQNCLGKISAYDFVRSLELLSNADGLTPPPDRRRAFRAIVRQYRMMQLMKRGGRGHDDSGVAGTGQGELALPCRACPQPDINLPDGWMRTRGTYKYYLFLAGDANFKMINRNVSTEARDPVVDDGTAYFCNRAEYSKHIRKHVDEEEMSSCSGFQAMFLANARRIKGLRVSGIGGITCARHNMWRANGVGDLQAGERFCNMDFLWFSALLNFALMWLILSYDIACQFSKNIWARMPDLPAKYHLKINRANVRWMVPNFHLPGHKKGCHSPFSFHWLWGAGCTHGETVEQNWEFLNGAAASTKLMALGARATALEGLLGFHNFRRQIAHWGLLKRRMAEAIKEGRAHQTSFDAFDEGLTTRMPELVQEWREWVDDWETTAHKENEKNSPYEYTETGITLKDVRLELAKEEYDVTGDGTEVERQDTPSTRQLAVAIKVAGAAPSTSEQLDILKRRTQLRIKLNSFRTMQKSYMPKLRQYLTPSQRAIWDADDKEPEATRLFMPSDFSSAKARTKACAKGLEEVEARLRLGEAGESLDGLRHGLRTRTATKKFKVRNWSGQRALTRGQGILRHINIKIHASKLRYRYARQAVLKLKGHGEWEDKLREGGISAVGDVVTGETHRSLSWIWYGVSAKNGDEKLHEALRVEWCKAYSRSKRWREELVLLEEEMRRTIEFGRWAEKRWVARASARTVMLGKTAAISPEVAEGVSAYALEHADRERRTWEALAVDWAPIRKRGEKYLKGDDISQEPELVIEVDRDTLRWAETVEFEREEADNDMYQ